MKAVGTDDVLAIDADGCVVVAIGDIGLVAIEIVRGDVRGIVDDFSAEPVARP